MRPSVVAAKGDVAVVAHRRPPVRITFLVMLLVMATWLLTPLATAKAQDQNVPMWEGVTKTERQRLADIAFIASVSKATKGNIELGVKRAIYLGWEFVAQNNPNEAIARFNQAWLLDPDYPDIYWGFAVATAHQGAPLPTVERFFAKAEKAKPNDPYLLADHGRILQQRGENEKAISYFQKALDINKEHRDAHVGMALAWRALGKNDIAEKHAVIALSLEGEN